MTPKFEKTSCSQCGREFGPGDHGFSRCEDHTQFVAVEVAVMRGHKREAVACSHNMAKRIAAALNRYRPGPKGY
jgi:hypothetical protein